MALITKTQLQTMLYTDRGKPFVNVNAQNVAWTDDITDRGQPFFYHTDEGGGPPPVVYNTAQMFMVF